MADASDAAIAQLSSSDESSDDYDPHTTHAQQTPASTTIGGFVEDRDDEEDQEQATGATDDPAPSGAEINGDALAIAAGVKSSSQAPSAAPLSNFPVPNASVVDSVTSSGGPGTPQTTTLEANDDSVRGKPESDLSGTTPMAATSTIPKAPLPHDIVGIFEHRIKEDPQGDVDAWMGLIVHHRLKQRHEEARKVYTRFFQIFPTAADQWLSYAQMELELDDIGRLEQIFRQALIKVHSVPLWTMYLNHVRRRHPIVDNSTAGRKVLTDAYKYVIDAIGNDPDAGHIWQEYIAFAKTAEGSISGVGWQDKQKQDALRPIYHAALAIPTQSVQIIWKDYGDFENTVHKVNARKYLTEKSPTYVTSRHTFAQLLKITETISRGATPRLPPLPGFDGEAEYQAQVKSWRDWIAFEKSDPLVLKDEGNHETFRKRVIYAYTHALMPLRFDPALWFEAAQFCFENEMNEQGNGLLAKGCEANPESALLAFARGNRIEQAGTMEEGESGAKKLGDAVRAPYDVTLDSLYSLIQKNTEREGIAVARIEEEFAAMTPEPGVDTPPPEDRQADAVEVEGGGKSEGEGDGADEGEGDDDDEDNPSKPLSRKAQKEQRIKQIKDANAVHFQQISMVITHVWIALMRAMRRVQGKGKPGEAMGGMRQIFLNEARKRGRILSDFWVAGALMEHNCYQDPAAVRIFERGLRVFPEDEKFVLEYIKHLINTGDVTNARAVFETTVAKITSNPTPANLEKAKLLYHFFHDFESKYGELAQIRSLEKRMAQLFPEDTNLTLFAERFYTPLMQRPVFDPTKVQLLLSPSQARALRSAPETIVESTEEASRATAAPTGYVQSPKRPLEDSEAEQPVRKLLRGESPLKGAAGRRQQQLLAQRQQAAAAAMGGPTPITPAIPPPAPSSGPAPLPAGIYNLLSVIPPARQWTETRFDPFKMVELIRGADLSRAKLRNDGLHK